MIRLSMNLPRDTPRALWIEANRWRRLTEHCLNAQTLNIRDNFGERINNLGAFGTTHPELLAA